MGVDIEADEDCVDWTELLKSAFKDSTEIDGHDTDVYSFSVLLAGQREP